MNTNEEPFWRTVIVAVARFLGFWSVVLLLMMIAALLFWPEW